MYKKYLLVIFIICLLPSLALASDWPTYRYDYQRSGVTLENVEMPLKQVWIFKSTNNPFPAWPAPAERDIWHNISELSPTMTYDRTFHPVVVGDKLFFGSSANGTVYCINANNGDIIWKFITGGPIRLAPAAYNNNLYIGSDDGYLYCLDINGNMKWKYSVNDKLHYLPGNGRIISKWPIRGGISVIDDTLYFSSGVFPAATGVFLHAVNLESGIEKWHKPIQISAQGYFPVTDSEIYVPTGRTAPAVFNRTNGQEIVYLGKSARRLQLNKSGSFAFIYKDMLIHGPAENGIMKILRPDKKSHTLKAHQLLVDDNGLYIQNNNKLTAFDTARYFALLQQQLLGNFKKNKQRFRELKENCKLWEIESKTFYEMIKAGNTIFAGGKDMVYGIDAKTGKYAFEQRINGVAYGLAVANGSLYVSTDSGYIYSFSSTGKTAAKTSLPAKSSFKSNPALESLSKSILNSGNRNRGYLFLFNDETGQLAYELVKNSELQVIIVLKDRTKVNQLRNKFSAPGMKGNRITVLEFIPDKTTFQHYIANIIVAVNTFDNKYLSDDQYMELLAPEGGTIFFTGPADKITPAALSSFKSELLSEWKFNKNNDSVYAFAGKGKLPGSGEWTHIYADPGNTACSGEQNDSGLFSIQWFGRPGPEKMVDRHHRSMPPLYKKGRIFTLGFDHLFCSDAYNGTLLWEKDLPDSSRLGIMHDTGVMAVDDDSLYIASADKCLVLDVKNGQERFVMQVPDKGLNWGYVAVVQNQVFGTSQKSTAARRDFGKKFIGQIEKDFSAKAFSRTLFSKDNRTGKTLWSYKKGAIINSTLAIGDNKIFFIESRNPEIVNNVKSQLVLNKIIEKNTWLVALNLQDGQKIWEKTLETDNIFEHIIFLEYSSNQLLLSGTYNTNEKVQYELHSFDSLKGNEIWEHTFTGKKAGGTHGEQWQHPAIIDDKVILMNGILDFKNGKVIKAASGAWRKGSGCGTISVSSSKIYSRNDGGFPYQFDFNKDTGIKLTKTTRPGCWINIIPAGGLILIPEASSGCTCKYSLQTSFALSPVNK